MTETKRHVDFASPVWMKTFVILIAQNHANEGELLKWLEKNGYPELATCPNCKGERFKHLVPACPIKQVAETMLQVMMPKVVEFGEELCDAIVNEQGAGGIERMKDALMTRKQ